MKERIAWVDISRGMAFLMIIYSHLDFTNETLMAYFTPMFLTTFFFVSGYLFNTKYSFIEVIEQRFRTILIPFFIYGVINIVLTQILTFGDKPPIAEAFYNFFMQIRGHDDGLWFLASLFVSTIPFYFMVKYTKGVALIALSTLFMAVNHYINSAPIPWHIELIAPSVFYMSLGFVYKQYEQVLARIITAKVAIISALVYLPLVTAHYRNFAEHVSFTTTNYVLDGLVITLLGLIICIYVSKKVDKLSGFLTFIGSNSLLYFCLHGKVFSIQQKIIYTVFNQLQLEITPAIQLALGFTITILTAIILMLPVTIINRYFKWTIGRGFRLTGKPSPLQAS
ncbi:acyltransferase family protein [Vibrio hannami]|uniref:acyltransferase family protein n=1 Tax=Vibrio hannami TaxID=2717094 RepID=UPI00240FF72D|nr:acyltransferase family protein [Vibrio hannami]MDG3085080.1 acyltransferase family protein [Vibrio hannami]